MIRALTSTCSVIVGKHVKHKSARRQDQVPHFWNKARPEVRPPLRLAWPCSSSPDISPDSRIHPCLDTIGFRFWLLNTAAVPHASVFGSIANSTPLLCSTRHVAWTSSLQNVTECGFSIWLSMFLHAKKHQFGIAAGDPHLNPALFMVEWRFMRTRNSPCRT